MVIGVGMAFQYPSLMALAVNRVDDRERPAVISSFTMFFEIGTVCGGLAFGVVAEVTSKRAAFGGCLLLCAFGLWLLRTRVAPLDEPGGAPMPSPSSSSPSPATDASEGFSAPEGFRAGRGASNPRGM